MPQENKEELFELKYNKYSAMIYRIAYQYTLNHHTAENVMQDVFVKLFLHKGKFNTQQHEKAWLIRVTINICKNILKSKSNTSLPLLYDAKACESENAEAKIINKIEIESALNQLNEDERVCMFLFYYEDYRIDEISQILKMNNNTVKSHLRRAKIKMKDFLK